MKALIVENEVATSQLLERTLLKNGFDQVDVVSDGEDGIHLGSMGYYDVMLIDVKLDKKDGVEVLRTLRSRQVITPILMLTSDPDVQQKVTGLRCGADGYILKPFDREELVARIEALIRRGAALSFEDQMTLGNLAFNPKLLTLASQDKSLHLPFKEAKILELLAKEMRLPLSIDHLIERAWDFEDDVVASTVHQHISRLRAKIKQLDGNLSIEVIRKQGYLLKVMDEVHLGCATRSS